MDKVRVRPLRPYEQEGLRRLERQEANAVDGRHAPIVLLSRGGLGSREIARRCDCTPQWARVIIHRFDEYGLGGITWCPWMCGRGKASRFGAPILERFAEIALSSPVAPIGMTRWSPSELRAYLVDPSRVAAGAAASAVRPLASDRDLEGVHRPRVPPEVQAHRAVVPQASRRRPPPPRGRVRAVEPAPRAGACLAGAGKEVERHRATFDRNGGVRHLLAAYDLESDELLGRPYALETWAQFLDSLKWLRRRYRKGETLDIVMDDYGPHLNNVLQG